jgi:hypothetical protein
VKKENLQEQQPKEDEQVLEWLWSTFVTLLTSVRQAPEHSKSLALSFKMHLSIYSYFVH